MSMNMSYNPNVQDNQVVIYFYYSVMCSESHRFNQLLEQYPVINAMITEKISIDNNYNIPREIQEVPCLYGNQGIFQGANAFQWLSHMAQKNGFSDVVESIDESFSFLDGNTNINNFNNDSAMFEYREGQANSGTRQGNEEIKIPKTAGPAPSLPSQLIPQETKQDNSMELSQEYNRLKEARGL